MIQLYLIIAGLSIALIGGAVLWIKDHRGIKKDLKAARALNKKVAAAEIEKGKIRDEQNKKENDILDNPAGDHDVLSVSTKKPKHNHARGDTCGEGCPAYDRDRG